MDEVAIARRRVEIVNTYGLHLRAAAKFEKLANSFRAEIWVDYRGIRGNGKSILDLVGLTAECGATLDLEARGPDALEALAALADLVAAGFHMTDEDARR
ncbi:MAG: HPr family phosphocarrier protein [Isosphaeraceae bacterium]|jgi:phosphocarrier protein HPr